MNHVTFAMPSLRVYRATDDLAREVVNRFVRFGLVLLGLAIVLAGILIAPLPGPGGIPVIVVGLMIVLRNSFKARRQFVKLQRAHPKMVFPIRRLLRREPEVFPVFWQQYLRVERVVLPKRARFAVRTRRRFKRRR
ncbi:PGPGW domain-containing protein [Phenylobacterium sp.]|uniref:PGPGW domain-containing protein n=1 Tax=Phenylobacterium sp. TaxID=1871053 RepID=UPI003919910B